MRRVGLTIGGALLGALAIAAGAGAATLEPIGAATYTQPTHVASDPRDPNRLFVTEQPGTIDVTTGAGTELFLDIEDLVANSGEQGLWSIAFAPDFAQSGLFYVAYSANGAGALTLDEFHEEATPAATRATRRNVWSIGSAANTNHNGGQLQFGPDDYLYWSTGEDAIAANAQDTANLLGKIVRIAPRSGIPPSIWALGLRNPWRFSFDRATGDMYIADVGAGSWEEINRGVEGANYGWPICEGVCTSPQPELTNPIYRYTSDDAPCNAITGGYVVRDPDLGDLFGRYLFSDACTNTLRSIDSSAPPPFDGDRGEGISAESPVSFGEDACGRLYVVAQGGGGRVFRIEGPNGGACPDGTPAPPDTDPPQTTLKIKRKSKSSTKAKVVIGSDEPGSTFECKLDQGEYKPCDERRKLKHLDRGKHKFRAVATDVAGNTDPNPAKKKFKVKR